MDVKPVASPFIPTLTLLIGGAVMLAGLFTIFGDSGSTAPCWTLAAIGCALKACGLLSLVYPAFRKHIMHVAILAALFGMGNVFSALPAQAEQWTQAQQVSAGCSILCAVLLAVYLKSFVNARRGNALDPSKPPN